MSTSLRLLTRHTHTFWQRTPPTASLPVRFFHSPFVALNSTSSPLTKPSSKSSTASVHYEKQHDYSPEPQTSHSGTQTYVVSEPDPAHTPYEVPSGAYPTSAPYVNFKSTGPPDAQSAPMSSTGSQPAHPYTTRAVPRNESGVQLPETRKRREKWVKKEEAAGSNVKTGH